MLQKLRSRHTIDLPYEGFGHKKGILAILGGIALLFVIVPLLLALAAGLLDVEGIIGIAAAFAALALVLIVAGIRGKSGHDR